MAAQYRVQSLLQTFAAAGGGVSKVEHELERAGDHIGRAGPCMNIRNLPCRRRKIVIAFVPARRRDLGDHRRDEMDGVPDKMRIRDMTLNAANDQGTRQRTAATVFDHVAEAIDRRGLADDAVIQRFAGIAQFVDDPRCAVDCRPFLVRGDQK